MNEGMTAAATIGISGIENGTGFANGCYVLGEEDGTPKEAGVARPATCARQGCPRLAKLWASKKTDLAAGGLERALVEHGRNETGCKWARSGPS